MKSQQVNIQTSEKLGVVELLSKIIHLNSGLVIQLYSENIISRRQLLPSLLGTQIHL